MRSFTDKIVHKKKFYFTKKLVKSIGGIALIFLNCVWKGVVARLCVGLCPRPSSSFVR